MPALSPKTRWNIARILPFGVIYLVTLWVFTLVEIAVHESAESSNYLVITFNLPIVIFASIASFLVGILIGIVELIWLKSLFRKKSLAKKIFYKFFTYTVGGVALFIILFPIAAALEYGMPVWDEVVLNLLAEFLLSITFFTSLLQMAFAVLLCLIYAAIAENLGHHILSNFFTGKYHVPKIEQRIFMFLDMKDSTTIAEELGHRQYFQLLQEYYDQMSDAIINTLGEVYQYIGDEVVITWKKKDGMLANNCIKCFYAIKENFKKRRATLQDKFQICPDFKAGIHLGEVTTGEVGALKKEIVYTGDVLNTTARIQGQCKTFQSDLIVSKEVYQNLEAPHLVSMKTLGKIELKGKRDSVELLAIESLQVSAAT